MMKEGFKVKFVGILVLVGIFPQFHCAVRPVFNRGEENKGNENGNERDKPQRPLSAGSGDEKKVDLDLDPDLSCWIGHVIMHDDVEAKIHCTPDDHHSYHSSLDFDPENSKIMTLDPTPQSNQKMNQVKRFSFHPTIENVDAYETFANSSPKLTHLTVWVVDIVENPEIHSSIAEILNSIFNSSQDTLQELSLWDSMGFLPELRIPILHNLSTLIFPQLFPPWTSNVMKNCTVFPQNFTFATNFPHLHHVSLNIDDSHRETFSFSPEGADVDFGIGTGFARETNDYNYNLNSLNDNFGQDSLNNQENGKTGLEKLDEKNPAIEKGSSSLWTHFFPKSTGPAPSVISMDLHSFAVGYEDLKHTFPNVSKLRMSKFSDTPGMPELRRSLWKWRGIESLEIAINSKLRSNLFPNLDSVFTGFSRDTVEKLYGISKQVDIQSDTDVDELEMDIEGLRENPSLIEMSELKTLKIDFSDFREENSDLVHSEFSNANDKNLHLSDDEDEDEFILLSWLTGEFDFKFMPDLQVQIHAKSPRVKAALKSLLNLKLANLEILN